MTARLRAGTHARGFLYDGCVVHAFLLHGPDPDLPCAKSLCRRERYQPHSM